VLTDGHFDQLTGAFFFLTTSQLLRQLFALPKFLATIAPLHVILQLKATTSVREVSKRLSWLRYGLARKTNCPSGRTVGVGGVTRHQGRAPYLHRHDGYKETMHALRKRAICLNRTPKFRNCPHNKGSRIAHLPTNIKINYTIMAQKKSDQIYSNTTLSIFFLF
jgi:hypothetical protein